MPKFTNNSMRPRKLVVVRPRRKSCFKWGIILVPGVILLAVWLASGVSVGVTWDDVMDVLRVHNRNRYTQLAILGLVAVGVVSIAKLLRKDGKDGD